MSVLILVKLVQSFNSCKNANPNCQIIIDAGNKNVPGIPVERVCRLAIQCFNRQIFDAIHKTQTPLKNAATDGKVENRKLQSALQSDSIGLVEIKELRCTRERKFLGCRKTDGQVNLGVRLC